MSHADKEIRLKLPLQFKRVFQEMDLYEFY